LAICVVSLLPPKWADVIGDLPLQPASYIVTLLTNIEQPGFEGQVGYLLLTVVLPWLVYSGVVYLLLAIWRKKRVSATAIKES
jgi:hypothetical protein